VLNPLTNKIRAINGSGGVCVNPYVHYDTFLDQQISTAGKDQYRLGRPAVGLIQHIMQAQEQSRIFNARLCIPADR
jgi:hypothetical protein